jgi:eukaryotic-like serine/threonine-protein kinase
VQAASALNHPNICTIYDLARKRPGIHRHGILGRRHAEAPHRRKSMELEMLLTLGIEIADALEAAHAKGAPRHQACEYFVTERAVTRKFWILVWQKSKA